MQYRSWRNDIFGQPPKADPVMLELLPETYSVSPEENLEHVDRALDDPEIHRLFSRDQIGIGLQLIYSNSCSSICSCYIEAADERRRIAGIRQMSNSTPITSIDTVAHRSAASETITSMVASPISATCCGTSLSSIPATLHRP